MARKENTKVEKNTEKNAKTTKAAPVTPKLPRLACVGGGILSLINRKRGFKS